MPLSVSITRRLAALVLAPLLVLLPLLAPGPAAAADPPDASGAPRGEARTVTKRGQQIKVRPLRAVQTVDGRAAAADRVLVGFKDGVGPAARAAVHGAAGQRAGVAARAAADIGPAIQAVNYSGGRTLEQVIAAYQADPNVAFAEPDYMMRAYITPTDPLLNQQWGMAKIRAPHAWNATTGSPARRIAVLDCGIYEAAVAVPNGFPGHPDINGKVVLHRDFTGSYTGADDYCDHGTHVAGIAAARTNNGLGVAGVGYNTLLMNGKVLDDDGSGFTSWIAAGVRWAADNGAHVINMSLGGDGACSATYRNAINYAWGRNVVVVAAAGNSGDDGNRIQQPASCPNTVAVASTTSTDAKSFFSQYGAWVDVAAPGSAVLSTDYVGGYVQKSGTSMAAPHVAGLAALIWSTNQYGTASAVVNRIFNTADRIGGTGPFWQHGRINAAAAVGGGPLQITGGHDVIGATAPRQEWYFAEGYTGTGFEEYLTIMNPGGAQAVVTITYYLEGGATDFEILVVEPARRRTVAVHDDTEGVGRGKAVAVRVTTTNPDGIVVERPMYFDFLGSIPGGHNVMGAAAPGTTWYFAEGYTGQGFYEYLTIMNPTGDPANVTITYYVEGGGTVQKPLVVGATSRETVAVHETARGVGPNKAVSAKVTSDVGIVVERPMYFTYGAGITGGHIVMGATDTDTTWYFAEGYTGTGFDEYLTILNPGAEGTATITYHVEGQAQPTVRTVPLPAGRRTTVTVHQDESASNPGGLGRLSVGHGTKVETSVPTVVERPMYFKYLGSIPGGHNVIGATDTSTTWYFAEGYTGTGFDAYLTILNPTGGDAQVRITYYMDDGSTKQVDLSVLAQKRATVQVHDTAQGVGRNKAVSAKVQSLNSVGIVVERPIYFTYLMN